MKAVLSILLAFCICFGVNAQEDDSLKVREVDTTNLILGKKQIRIVEKDGETDIKVKDRDDIENEENEEVAEEHEHEYEYEESDDDDFSWPNRKSKREFKGHWDAFQIGINSYLSADKSTSLPVEDEFMELNTNKSINININLFQQSFGFVSSNYALGIISGLGLEYANYVFDDNIYIIKAENGQIIPQDPGFKLDKSKLTTSYLTVPLLLELQFPGNRRANRLFLNAGVIGGVKLGSHTKYKYKENGDKQDKKNRNDFNLNALRYGFTGRIGIKHISIYGTYYPVTLFEKNKGPELYPFMVGFSFDGF